MEFEKRECIVADKATVSESATAIVTEDAIIDNESICECDVPELYTLEKATLEIKCLKCKLANSRKTIEAHGSKIDALQALVTTQHDVLHTCIDTIADITDILEKKFFGTAALTDKLTQLVAYKKEGETDA